MMVLGTLFRWFGLLFMVIVLVFCFGSICGLFILQFDFVYFNGLVYLLICVVISGFCWLVWLVVGVSFCWLGFDCVVCLVDLVCCLVVYCCLFS